LIFGTGAAAVWFLFVQMEKWLSFYWKPDFLLLWCKGYALRSFIGFGTYISMFPQLIAGPIVTYSAVKEQIKKRRISFLMIERGLREFTIGLGLWA
jgi:hypothetical protein